MHYLYFQHSIFYLAYFSQKYEYQHKFVHCLIQKQTKSFQFLTYKRTPVIEPGQIQSESRTKLS